MRTHVSILGGPAAMVPPASPRVRGARGFLGLAVSGGGALLLLSDLVRHLV